MNEIKFVLSSCLLCWWWPPPIIHCSHLGLEKASGGGWSLGKGGEEMEKAKEETDRGRDFLFFFLEIVVM